MGMKSDLVGLTVAFVLVGVGVGAFWSRTHPSARPGPEAEADKHVVMIAPPAPRPPPAPRTPPVPVPAIQAPASQAAASFATQPPAPSGSPPLLPPGSFAGMGAPTATGQAPAPPRLPSVITPNGQEDSTHSPYVVATLPVILRPAERGQPTMLTGTGFFIAADGSVMTVAHVVKDCRLIAIASRHLKPTPAKLVASDADNDLALLRAVKTRPPAALSFAPRPSGAARLDIFGSPGEGDDLVPTETLGTLRTARPPFRANEKRDYLWMDAKEVVNGFSGGPVLGPDGAVVGLVNGFITTRQVTKTGEGAELKVTYGASTRMIDAFLRREVPAIALDDGRHAGHTVSEVADKAIVHVYCTM